MKLELKEWPLGLTLTLIIGGKSFVRSMGETSSNQKRRTAQIKRAQVEALAVMFALDTLVPGTTDYTEALLP